MTSTRKFIILALTVYSSITLAANNSLLGQPPQPTQERYCDPNQNTQAFAQIKQYETQFHKLDTATDFNQTSQKMTLLHNIQQAHVNLKCVTRSVNQSNSAQ